MVRSLADRTFQLRSRSQPRWALRAGSGARAAGAGEPPAGHHGHGPLVLLRFGERAGDVGLRAVGAPARQGAPHPQWGPAGQGRAGVRLRHGDAAGLRRGAAEGGGGLRSCLLILFVTLSTASF